MWGELSFVRIFPELRNKQEKFAQATEGVTTCHLSAVNAEYVAKLIKKHGTDCQVGLSWAEPVVWFYENQPSLPGK